MRALGVLLAGPKSVARPDLEPKPVSGLNGNVKTRNSPSSISQESESNLITSVCTSLGLAKRQAAAKIRLAAAQSRSNQWPCCLAANKDTNLYTGLGISISNCGAESTCCAPPGQVSRVAIHGLLVS